MRSGRSWSGTALRLYVALSLVVVGFLQPRFSLAWGLLIGLGVLTFFIFPLVGFALLKPIQRRVEACPKKDAADLLKALRGRWAVRIFAPVAWISLQEGKLQLCLDDGRAAAKAFAATARLSRVSGKKPELLSAQAHGLLMAGDRREARMMLQTLAKTETLAARDQLNLGIALVLENGDPGEAEERLSSARETFGDHPRLLAALALAMEKSKRGGAEALKLFRAARAVIQTEEDRSEVARDLLALELLKRGRKVFRAQLRGKEKRVRTKSVDKLVRAPAPASTAVLGAMTNKGDKEVKRETKSSKNARKRARRDARRAAKSEQKAERQLVREEGVKRRERRRRKEMERTLVAPRPPSARKLFAGLGAPVAGASPLNSASARTRPSAVQQRRKSETAGTTAPRVVPTAPIVPAMTAPPLPEMGTASAGTVGFDDDWGEALEGLVVPSPGRIEKD